MCAERKKWDAISRNTDNHKDEKQYSKSNSTAASPSSIEVITTMGADLVRQLLADVDVLFISQPLTII